MKVTYPILALVGGTLVVVPIYLEASSIDLGRYPLGQYIAADTALPAWWAIVVFPFLVGVCFLVAAAVGARTRPNRKATIRILAVCLALALLLCLVNVPLGVYAAVSLLLLLLVGYIRPSPSLPSKP
jgi:lipopolysaccharide export LptBFGC system permease protein LptF